MPGERLVVTWRDGFVATYDNVSHSTPPGWLIVHRDSAVLWKFPANSIRAVGSEPWHADGVNGMFAGQPQKPDNSPL